MEVVTRAFNVVGVTALRRGPQLRRCRRSEVNRHPSADGLSGPEDRRERKQIRSRPGLV